MKKALNLAANLLLLVLGAESIGALIANTIHSLFTKEDSYL